MSAIDLTLGCIFIGVILNVWLYGFSCVQAYIYFARFKSDRTSLRVFVAFLFCADTLNSALDTVFLYKYLVTHFGDKFYSSIGNNEFATDPLCVQIVGFATQLFFAWRIWKLVPGKFNWVPALIICLLGFLSFLGALGTTVGVVIVRNFAEFQKFEVTVALWLSCTAAADIMVTVSLITTLHRSRTGFTHTDDLLTKLIRATLQTGLLTTSFAVTDLILFVSSTTTLHLVFNLPLSKLYINSLLSTLNARAFISKGGHSMRPVNSSNLQIHGVSDMSNLKLAEAGLSSGLSSALSGKKEDSEGILSRTTELTSAIEIDSMPSPDPRSPVGRPSYEGSKKKSSKFKSAWKRTTDPKAFVGVKETENEHEVSRSPYDENEEGVHVVTVQERFESDLPRSRDSVAPALSFSNLNNKSMASFTDSQRSIGNSIQKGGEEGIAYHHNQHQDDSIEDNEGNNMTNSVPLQKIQSRQASPNKNTLSPVGATSNRQSITARHPYSQC